MDLIRWQNYDGYEYIPKGKIEIGSFPLIVGSVYVAYRFFNWIEELARN